jgi:hypothetical protein
MNKILNEIKAFFSWLFINKIYGSPYCAKCGACRKEECCHSSLCEHGLGCLYSKEYSLNNTEDSYL